MSTTIRPITSINSNQLHDDVIETAISNGFTEKDVLTLQRQLAYRKQYNRRPDVVAKRAAYTRERYLKMKALKSLLSQM